MSNEDPFVQAVQQVAKHANNAGLSVQDFAKAMNSFDVATRRFRREASAVIRHDPSRLPYWPIVATPEIGCFGRIRWINSEPSEQVWGRFWWGSR
jgi:hypothetical protein